MDMTQQLNVIQQAVNRFHCTYTWYGQVTQILSIACLTVYNLELDAREILTKPEKKYKLIYKVCMIIVTWLIVELVCLDIVYYAVSALARNR